MTGWGQTGTYASMAGHDINYIGLAGALAAIGTRALPIPPLNLVGDFGGGGMFAVAGILAAVFERSVSGTGQVLDVAMVDGVGTLMGPIRDLVNAGVWRDEREANFLDGGAPFYRCYETAEGAYVAVGALEPQFYDQLLSGLDLDENDLGNRFDRDNWPTIARQISSVFARRTREEWMEVFDGTDACVTPVLTLSEVQAHVHNHDRGALRDGPSGSIPAIAPRFERLDADAPVPGVDVDAAIGFLDEMGLDVGTVDAMLASGTLRWV